MALLRPQLKRILDHRGALVVFGSRYQEAGYYNQRGDLAGFVWLRLVEA